jgi:hypothetical protein
MVNRCSELLCLKENIWEEINQNNNKIKLFKRNDKYLAILYDMFYFNEFKKVLSSLDKQVSIYTFSHYKLLKEDFEDINKDSLEELMITIKNNGNYDSHLPIQVYVKPLHDKYRVPHFKLTNIDNIYVKSGQTVTLPLDFDSANVKTVNKKGERVYDCDSFMIYVGYSQPDERSFELLGHKPFEKEIVLNK